MLDAIAGRNAGAWVLLLAAAVSVALACCGAERALAAMRHPLGCAALGVLAFGAVFAACRRLAGSEKPRLSPSLLFHLGFALVLGAWIVNRTVGPEGGYLKLRAGQTGAVADAFTLAVRDFRIERYPESQAVSQYRCAVEIDAPGAPAFQTEISVNHPFARDGWWIYQSSYEEMTNPHTGEPFYFTILECVKDVGLPFALAGGLLLVLAALWYAVAAFGSVSAVEASVDRTKASSTRVAFRAAYALAFCGAVAMLVRRGLATGHPPMQNMYEFLMCTLVLLPVLTCVSAKTDGEDTLAVDAPMMALVALPVLFFMDPSVKKLMPALQSPFFVPHVGAYVAGYVLLVRAAFGAGRRLVGTGFLLLTVGLVLGAAWGKVCWGHWWQFDPKEMWSLATWFTYLAYFHVKGRLSSRARNVFLAAGAAMIVLTLTWINLSRMFSGMHSYA